MTDKVTTGSFGDTKLKDLGGGVYAPAEYSYAEQMTKLDPINDAVTTYSGGSYITTINASGSGNTVVCAFPAYIDEMRVLDNAGASTIQVYNNTAASGTDIPIPSKAYATGSVLIGRTAIASVGWTVAVGGACVVTILWRPQ